MLIAYIDGSHNDDIEVVAGVVGQRDTLYLRQYGGVRRSPDIERDEVVLADRPQQAPLLVPVHTVGTG